MSRIFDGAGRYVPPAARTCQRCGYVLVDEDEVGPYYQQPQEANMGPLYDGGPDTVLVSAGRVHTCGEDDQPHELPAMEQDRAALAAFGIAAEEADLAGYFRAFGQTGGRRGIPERGKRDDGDG